MKITAIKVGIGDGSDPRYVRNVAISADFESDLAEAVERDHNCEDSACDIRAALEQGFTYTAAHLLIGATECVNVEGCIDAHAFNRTLPDGAMMTPSGWPSDFDDWKAYHDEHGRECAKCRAFNYPSGGCSAESCSNCLAALPDEESEDEESEDEES